MSCLPTLSRRDPQPEGEGTRAALRDAQERLKQLDLYAGEVDGIYGQRTEQAVIDLQKRRGLTVDGIIGPQTWGALYADEAREGRLPYEERVSTAFAQEVRRISAALGLDPGWLMAIMAFETGGTFDPSEKNRAGSGATGLIQFMPATARGLGTSTEALAEMDAVEQLRYVEKYFEQAGEVGSLEDAYMAVLWPAAVGKPNSYVLFRRPSVAYRQNRGLDRNGNGEITKWEAAAKVRQRYEKGLLSA